MGHLMAQDVTVASYTPGTDVLAKNRFNDDDQKPILRAPTDDEYFRNLMAKSDQAEANRTGRMVVGYNGEMFYPQR
jgi:hypothetical protein